MQEAPQNVYGIMAGNYLQGVTESASDKTAFYAGRCYFEVKMLEADLGVAAITVKGIYEGVQSGITRLGTLLDDSIGIGGGGAAVIAANGSAAYAGLGNLAAIGALLSAAPGSLSGMEQRLGRLQENFEKMLESGKGGSGAGKGDSGAKSIDDILDGAEETTNNAGIARNFEKTGGYEKTLEDFNALQPSNVKDIQTQYGPGKVGYLEDGTTVVARPGSQTGGATLEIKISNKKIYKIRY